MLCRHREQKFVRNIHGDEIWDIARRKHLFKFVIYRSWWRCEKCVSRLQ